MKNLNIVIAAVLLFALLAGIGSAVPRAPQDMGLLDTNYTLVPAAECRECHTAANDEHHMMVFNNPPTTTLGCNDCHPLNNTNYPIYEKDCKACHKAKYGWNASQTQDITVWDENATLVNLSRLRGRGTPTSFSNAGLPHHNTTKNATWNSQKIAYWAADRKCDLCHGTGIVARFNDGHYVPTYNNSMISPLATFKINATIGNGIEWGGCFSCHDDDVNAEPELLNPDETHHGARMYEGYQCNDCHVAKGIRAEPVPDRNPDPSANYYRISLYDAYPLYATMFQWDNKTKFEFRNATMIQNGDTLNGTGCEKCHSVQTLHNIEVNAAYNIANQIPGKGHIGNSSDCNGCHSAVAASTNPFPGEKSVSLNGVNPGRTTAGVATDVTLTGDNFVEAPYQTVVLVDGNAVTQKSITDTQIVVTIPASLAKGGHSIQVKKGAVTSGLRMLSVSSTSTITSAKLRSGVLTITGAEFGPQPAAEFADLGVFVTHTTTVKRKTTTTTFKATVVSWTNTQIVVNAGTAAVNDQITVKTLNGQNNINIAKK